MGDQEKKSPGMISRTTTSAAPMNRVVNRCGTRSRRVDLEEDPTPIIGKGYHGRNSRKPTHFAATSDQWAGVGEELMARTALISYSYGDGGQGVNI